MGINRQTQVVDFFRDIGLGLCKAALPYADDTDIDLVFDDADFEDFLEPELRPVSPRPIEGADEISTNAAQVSGLIEEDEFFDAAGSS